MEDAQRGAAPTGIGIRCRDDDVVAGSGERTGQHVEAFGVDAVVVGDQQAHAANVAEPK